MEAGWLPANRSPRVKLSVWKLIQAKVQANDNTVVVTDYEFTFNIDFSRIETGKYLTQRDDGLSKTELARGEYGSTIGGYGQSAKLDYQRLQVIFWISD